MKPPSQTNPLEHRLQEAVDQLEREGYTVQREPHPHELPEQLRSWKVDYIARRGPEIVIGEVASRSTAKRTGIDALARVVESIPHARLEVSWLGDADEEPPRVRQVSDYVDEARTAANVSPRAGFLLAIAAFEGALALYADRIGFKPQAPPRQVLEELFSLGYIDESDHIRLSGLYRLRSGIAHGVTTDVPAPSDISYVLHLTNRMLRGRYTSEDVVAEWVHENIDDLTRRYAERPGRTQFQPDIDDRFQPWLVERAREHFPHATVKTLRYAVRLALL
jgi:REase_AHJR-like